MLDSRDFISLEFTLIGIRVLPPNQVLSIIYPSSFIWFIILFLLFSSFVVVLEFSNLKILIFLVFQFFLQNNILIFWVIANPFLFCSFSCVYFLIYKILAYFSRSFISRSVVVPLTFIFGILLQIPVLKGPLIFVSCW